ncbi:MAG: nucleotidyltransferase domain-containing protein [Pseudomonadota bacterium]
MQKELTYTNIINSLKAEKDFLCKEYGVIEIGLFGSYAFGTPNKDSDIDLLIEFKEPKFEHLAGLIIYLENKFNKKIEIIRKSKNIKSRFIQGIENKVIYV